jgi:thiamine-monophosphate kinase
MSLGEFDLIQHFFTRPVRRSPLGVGDDCALLAPTPGMQLAVSTDMLVEGRHFVSTVAPRRLGHKALAVNLSDLAACGAKPLAYTLAFALPRADAAWLGELAAGLHALADEHGIELVGGDTTAGPLNLCITVFGEVPTGQALLRSGSAPGDDLWVSGRTLGDARLALEVLRGSMRLPGNAFEQVRRAMEQPAPRVALGQALRGVASAAIDISDGLLGDLGHVLRRSGAVRNAAVAGGAGVTVSAPTETVSHSATVSALAAPISAATATFASPSSAAPPLGATLFAADLPRSAVLAALPAEQQLEYLLAGGDDYELLFTAPPALADAVRAAGTASATEVSRIGRIEAEPGVRVVDADGRILATPWASFDHFR